MQKQSRDGLRTKEMQVGKGEELMRSEVAGEE